MAWCTTAERDDEPRLRTYSSTKATSSSGRLTLSFIPAMLPPGQFVCYLWYYQHGSQPTFVCLLRPADPAGARLLRPVRPQAAARPRPGRPRAGRLRPRSADRHLRPAPCPVVIIRPSVPVARGPAAIGWM